MMPRTFAWLFAACAALPGSPAAAQDVIAQYAAWISPRDMQNSSGVRLTDWCAMVQQDRANYHRLGQRDQGDQGDGVFASRDARAAIAGNCQGSDFVRSRLQNGEPTYVWVRVFGRGDQVQFVVVENGAG
jgi:beta-lactamase class A